MSAHMGNPVLLGIWTVYQRPLDYPDGFIARLFHVTRDGHYPTEHTLTGATLDEVRAQLPPHLHCLGRQPEDEPQIVESYI